MRSHGVIPNRVESVRKLIRKLGPAGAAEGLLRGWSDGLRAVLATDAAGSGVRGDRTEPGTRPRLATESRPIGAMRRNWRAVTGPES